jgi:uncharacterized protein YbcI
VRLYLLETAQPLMEAMIKKLPGVPMVGLHHDIRTVTGEEVVLLRLASRPRCRETGKR